MADLPRQTRVQHQAQVQAQQQTESSTASSPTTATTNIHLRTLPHHKSYSSMQMHGIGPPSPTSSSRLSASPYASWGSRRASIASEMAFSNPTRPGGGFTLGVRPRLLTRQSLEFNRAHTHNASSIVTTVSIGTGGPRRATSVGLVGSPSLHQVWQEGWEPSSSSRPFAIGDSRSRAMARTMGSEVSGPSSGSGARSNMHGLGRSASIGSVPSVRRVKSGSHLAESLSVSKSHVSTVDPSPPTPVNKGKGVARTKSSQKKNKGGIMKGLSMRAEQFVRGLDAALDFVDESRMDTREPSPGEFDGKLKVLPHSFH
ncbi:hypothetical protein DL96DRAFT_458774 [Flagelloscypha sp. PMI_526]|nr:hypothetical protein DL96DRAFT_458774 [Flagelloscypha sp. PMI_526]